MLQFGDETGVGADEGQLSDCRRFVVACLGMFFGHFQRDVRRAPLAGFLLHHADTLVRIRGLIEQAALLAVQHQRALFAQHGLAVAVKLVADDQVVLKADLLAGLPRSLGQVSGDGILEHAVDMIVQVALGVRPQAACRSGDAERIGGLVGRGWAWPP